MEVVTLQSVSKVFRHRPALFNWIGRERASETRALEDISLCAGQGEVLVLLGPNGSGKTTLLKLVSTFLLPDQGRILVLGADAVRQPDRVRPAVGFALAEARSFYPRLTGFENLDFFAALECVPRSQRSERVAWALEMAELSDAADILAMKYSSGMFQRLGVARALLKKPSVLLLDEPTRSLDPAAARHLWRLVQRMAEAGTTVLLATHNFDEAIQLGSTVAILRGGRLVASRALGSGMAVEELRSFYFSQFEPSSEFAAPILGGLP
jgi:ABC-2 type transport system ATP-binding protein